VSDATTEVRVYNTWLQLVMYAIMAFSQMHLGAIRWHQLQSGSAIVCHSKGSFFFVLAVITSINLRSFEFRYISAQCIWCLLFLCNFAFMDLCGLSQIKKVNRSFAV